MIWRRISLGNRLLLVTPTPVCELGAGIFLVYSLIRRWF
jgi:hypothetical protein